MLVCRPSARSDRPEQYIFINARPAGAPIVSGAIREATARCYLGTDIRWFFYFWSWILHWWMSMCIRPNARFRFYNPGAVREAVTAAVRQAWRPTVSAPLCRSRSGRWFLRLEDCFSAVRPATGIRR